MPETLDHAAAQTVFQRMVTGVRVDPRELARALAHVPGCDRCARLFELGPTPACEQVEDDLPDAAKWLREGEALERRAPELARHVADCERCRTILAELVQEPPELAEVAEIQVDPQELFESALTAALSDPDSVARRRAAERLGTFGRLAPAALAALADAAAEDADRTVRAASLEALDRLDAQVSLAQRVIEEWSTAPAEAAPYLAGVLARLASERPPAHRGVTELVATGEVGKGKLALAGKAGIEAYLTEEKNRLWLTVDRLPGSLENTRPVAVFPDVLASRSRWVKWAGKEPGLVAAKKRVAGGSLRIPLGEVAKAGIAEKARSLRRIFLLNPEPRDERAG